MLFYEKYEAQVFVSEKPGEGTVLSRCKYFETLVYDIEKELHIETDDSQFLSIVCIKGFGIMEC